MTTKRNNVLRVALQILLPLLVLVGSVAGGMAIIANQPTPPRVEPTPPVPPLVRVLSVEVIKAGHLMVESQGTVQPRRRTALASQVGGRVAYVSPALVQGGFFREGDVLLRIESADFQQALANARQALANAELALEQERIEARLAVEEWRRLGREGDPPAMVARRPQVAAREAAVAAAHEAVARAERDVQRTVLRAPYDGRVESKQVDAGEIVGPGQPVATLVSTGAVEVRLPVALEDLPILDLPFSYADTATTSRSETRGAMDNGNGNGGNDSGLPLVGPDGMTRTLADGPPPREMESRPRVTLRLPAGDRTYTWTGHIVRTEGRVDPRTRTLVAVAHVDRPYEPGDEDPQRPPLLDGMYVEAEITGRTVNGVRVLPRTAVRNGNEVLVARPATEADGLVVTLPAADGVALGVLEMRRVEVLRHTTDTVVVANGIGEGELLIVSPLATPIDGMAVRYRVDGATAKELNGLAEAAAATQSAGEPDTVAEADAADEEDTTAPVPANEGGR